ncbi:phage/plasmid primase, P4 family [Mycolicibacterium conceptionense]|uniref:phage/plasmid primase, P4 family n=1 Tax=Mycolicibacterium conceptionense TaxID=451644 RepID=UPI000662C2FB|nr:phage/plasmid primase, P4 family [Mycolicibacterium conceptionense]
MNFSDNARRYLDAGYAPIPLPKGQKHPPPTGFIGGNGKRADTDQLEAWAESSKYKSGNLACWFGEPITVDGVQYQLVGIDVDHYGEKRGGDQLAALEKQLGQLSDRAPWISSSRTDGHSGIRWYLAPTVGSDGKRIEFRGKADQGIDVIQRKHRYAVVWPSVVEDRQYWWFPPGLALTDDGRNGPAAWRDDHPLPVIAEFPILADSWVTYLREHRSHGGEIDLSIGVTDLHRWAEEVFNDGQADQTCWNVATSLATYTKKITEDESSHDKITDAHWMLYSLAAEGHTGWKDAVTELEAHWVNNVGTAGKRNLTEALSEVFRSRTGALRKIKVRVDRDGVLTTCTCAGVGATLWHTDKVPFEVAKQFALANEREETPLRLWRDDWYQYTGQRWKRLEKNALNKLLYDRLGGVTCLKPVKGGGFESVPWNPTDRKVSAVEHALRAVTLLDAENVEAPCWLNGRTDQVIALQNSLLRIADRKQIEHTPNYFNMNVLPFNYDPAAPKPTRWIQFLSELWPDDPNSIALLQEWFGYVLSGQTNMHKMLMLIGPRRTGKTTVAHILRTLVGGANQTQCHSADMVGSHGMMNLIGSTLGIFDDDRITGNAKRFVDILKNIIGEGQVTIKRKYIDDWQGKLSTRFVYIANELSAFPDSSGAITERMLPLETLNSFEDKPDRQLREKLEAEISGIFNWALDGLDRLNKHGHFTVPESSRQMKDELDAAASPITEFIEETCVWDEDGFVYRRRIYTLWKLWCEENGYQPGSMNSFLAKLRAAYGNKVRCGPNDKRGPSGAQDRACIGMVLRIEYDRPPGDVIQLARIRAEKAGISTTVSTDGGVTNGL